MPREILVRPFSTNVWLAFASVFVITAIIFHLTQHWKFQKEQKDDAQHHEIQNLKFCSQMNQEAQNIDSVWPDKHECTYDGLLTSFQQSQIDHEIPVEADSKDGKQISGISSHVDTIKHRKAFDEHQGLKTEYAGQRDYGAFLLRSTLGQGAAWDPCNNSTPNHLQFLQCWLVSDYGSLHRKPCVTIICQKRNYTV